MADKRKVPPMAGAAGDVTSVVKRVRQGEGALTQTQRRTSALSSAVISLQGAHTAEVLDVKFSPCGEKIAAASADHSVSLWETYRGNRNLGLLTSHSRAVTCVAWAPTAEGEVVVSGSADNTVIAWNAKTGQKLRRFRGHKGIVNGVACTRTGRPLIASASDDGRVLVWDLDERHFVDALDFGYPVTAVAFSEDATQLFVGGVDNAIHAMDLTTKQRQYSLRGHLDSIASLALSRSGTHLLSSALDDAVRIWDVRPFAPEARPGDTGSPRLYRTLTGQPSGFENILIKAAWSMDGERVASGGADRACSIWDVEKGAILYKLPGHRGTCTAVDMHPLEPIGTYPLLTQSSPPPRTAHCSWAKSSRNRS